MPSHREIARDWGTSPAYVDQCVKRGCPTDTFENARDWRLAHQQRAPKRKPKTREEQVKDLVNQLDLEKEVTTIADAERVVEIAKENVIETRLLLREAFIEKKPSKISTFLNLNGKATENWYKAEAILVNKKKEAGILVPLAEAMARARKMYDPIIQRLMALPQNIASAVNPHDPAHAMDILQAEMASILADAQKAVS